MVGGEKLDLAALPEMSGSSSSDCICMGPREQYWQQEAREVIFDVGSHVRELVISPVLRFTNIGAYLNLTTLEGLRYTVELSSAGFRTVAYRYDSIEEGESGDYFDTPYALLSALSPAFPESFANLLKRRLQGLCQFLEINRTDF